ncbi:hypothetical protein PL9214500164 [Planktothrix tepida PCC 9214]|uniref:Uncharacterized protein n=1 Tax=Planktothrix tepida PCC 9214 TaxID=671072 RepID=A0A1J1LK11_9CYAN|nr:hypothetical protein PL9214500164 [Planktothrix tepida PCC 9214]
MLKKQKGKCNLCGQYFTPDDVVEIGTQFNPNLYVGKTNIRTYNYCIAIVTILKRHPMDLTTQRKPDVLNDRTGN